jgi:1-acyl-sn-glycerol-3-phosphate acyltransferase
MAETLSKPHQSDDWRQRVVWPLHENWHVKLLKICGRIWFLPLYQIECTGLENIPPAGPCILAPNHIGAFDPVVLALYLPRHAFFMTKIELYRHFFARWFIRHWGAFPVERGQRDAWAIEHASRVLQAGQLLCMFPEGTRSKNQAKLSKGKLGTAKLALQHRVPVLPTAILGTHLIRPGRTRPKVTIQVDGPLDLVSLAGPPPYDQQTLRAMTTIIMQHIAAMLPPPHRGAYADKPGLLDED